jgi:biopolymer transport protein ExbD
MTYQIRHQGSSAARSLSAEQIVQGLRDGVLDPLDEVKGPGDVEWQSLEAHARFAEVAEEVTAPPPRRHDEPTSLDMNALIDVCLVLLIFFILTTSYAATVQKVVPLPDLKNEARKLRTVKVQDVRNRMIRVQATVDAGGKTVVRVENQTVDVIAAGAVDPDRFAAALKPHVRVDERRTELLLDAQGIRWADFISLQDGAKLANIKAIHMLRSVP